MISTWESSRLGREFSELGVVEVWPIPLGRFRPALVLQAGVATTTVVRVAWVTAGTLVVGTGGV